MSALEFKVASYNVENLFDVEQSGQEYKEYIPNTQNGWNEKMLSIKIKNISKVIKELDADVLALHEVENKEVLKRLNLALGSRKYPYMYTSLKRKKIDSVLLSRYPIKMHSSYNVIQKFRPIYKVILQIDEKLIAIFINHWPSYKNGNAKRMQYAKALEKLYKKEDNFILLGDFNSPLHVNKKGWGKAASYISKENYNLWFEQSYKNRYSYAFFGRKSALDHIILSKSVHEDLYKDSSFHSFKPNYLVDKYKNPIRWKISKKGKGKHLGVGYSDHLPIVATFDTKKQTQNKLLHVNINKLLKTDEQRVNYFLKDVMVIDKNKYGITIEDKNRDTIFVYKPDFNLNIGKIYNLHVRELGDYKGKREIMLMEVLNR